jgi:hypothetical protein
VSLNEYIEAERDAARTAKNKVNTSKHAAPGPGWIGKYLEKELPQCDKDTPFCSPCIEEHETKYSRKCDKDLHFEEGEYGECEVNGEGFRFVVPASEFVVAEQRAKRQTRRNGIYTPDKACLFLA